MKTLETLAELKTLARKHYTRYHELTNDFGCGKVLAEHIKPEAEQARLAFNEVWARIEALDPTAPRGRL